MQLRAGYHHLRLAIREERSGLTNAKNWSHLLFGTLGHYFFESLLDSNRKKSYA